jgi:hypothetical protein
MFKNTLRVGDPLIFWDLIPAKALSDPLTDVWDHVECPVCDVPFYRLGLSEHLKTHRYREKLWLRLLKKTMTRV